MEADAAGEKCAKCGSNTFAKNDPQVRALFARDGEQADEKSAFAKYQQSKRREREAALQSVGTSPRISKR
jgi:hypothetical protein